MACDGSVRQIVKLLQEVSQKQWQGKGEKRFMGLPFVMSSVLPVGFVFFIVISSFRLFCYEYSEKYALAAFNKASYTIRKTTFQKGDTYDP